MFKQLLAAVALVLMTSSCLCGPGLEPEPDAGPPNADTPDASITLDAGARDGGAPATDAGAADAGGVPDIEVSPQAATINLGEVAFFPGAHIAHFASTRLIIRNVGTATLRLGNGSGSFWQATPASGTDPAEFCVGSYDAPSGLCVGTLPGYDPARGLLPGAQIELPVRITPSGLGVRGLELVLFSNDPDEPTTTRRLEANALVLPECDLESLAAALDFGVMTAGSIVDQQVTLRNRLTGPNDLCLVSNIEVTGSSAFELIDTPSSFTLLPGASAKLTVRARAPAPAPASLTPVAGQLGFFVAHRNAAPRVVPLSATFGRSCLQLSPAPYDFGPVAVGCTSSIRRFDAFNLCSTDLELLSATSSNRFGGVPGFTGNTRLAGYSALAGAVTARFRPATLGADQDVLRVEVTQDGQQVSYIVPLEGRGVAPGPVVETMPAHTGKVDVMMVIDSSCSMEPVQPSLRQHLPELLDYATSRQVDFRLAVGPSNDFGDLRLLDGGAAWVEPTTPNLGAAYRELVDVGTLGDRENCAGQVLRMLSPEKRASSVNGTFLRADAAFAVVCITDTPDYATPARDLPLLLRIKGPQQVSLSRYSVMSPFSPAPVGCPYEPLSSTPPHDAFIAATEGAREELCTMDWPGAMRRIAAATFDRRSEYDLFGAPDLASSIGVQVLVDGVAWPEVSTTTPAIRQWTYDVLRNRVAFNPLTQPPVGSTISVRYEPVCLP